MNVQHWWRRRGNVLHLRHHCGHGDTCFADVWQTKAGLCKLEIATMELYRAGGKQDGVLARETGEGVPSYVSSCQCRSLTTFDKTFRIQEHFET